MFPTPLEILMAWTLNLRRRLLAPVLDAIDEMEARLMTRADELVARLNDATNELASDLRDLRSALEDATAGSDSKVAQAVNAALDGFEGPISALEAMGADQSAPVPDAPAGPGPSDGGDGIPAGPTRPSEEPDTEPGDGQLPNDQQG